MQKGREEALSPFLRLLRKAVGELPADVERRLRKLPRARLDKLADALPSMKSLAELKAWLARRSSR